MYSSFGTRNTVSTREFERQMGHLRRQFRPVTPEQVLAWVEKGASLPDRAVLVTFDDGYRNNLTHALPVLLRHGISAMIVV